MKEMFHYLNPGSYVMYLILLLSIVAIGFIVERFLAFSSSRTDMDRFFPEFENRIRQARLEEAHDLCQGETGVIPRVLALGVENRQAETANLGQILSDEVQIEVLPSLEKNLTVLSTIARGAPMLGLLGTVMGMIQLFQSIQTRPDFDVTDISGGIFTALGTTAAGMMVAIPILFFHAYFRTRVRGFELDLYRYLTRFLRIETGPTESP